MMTEKRRLKILFLPAWYPTKENPVVGIFVKEHAKAVSLDNDLVVIYAYLDPFPQLKRFFQISKENYDGIETLRVKYGGIFSYIRNLIRPLGKNKDKGKVVKQSERIGSKGILFKILKFPYIVVNELLYCWSIFTAFRKLFKEGWKPDIIHAHVYSAGVPAVILGKIYKIPVVITEHWTGFPRHILGKFEIFKARFAMNRAEILLPVSQNLKESIESYGIKNRFQVIPNVINIEMFYPLTSQHRSEKKRILLVALLSPVKGIPYLLRALAQLKEKRQDFILDIVGDGPNRQEYEELTKNLGLGEMVRFHGLKSKPEVAEYMRQCDFFVLPSLWENLPCVLIEAMASGTPVIATDVGGVKEMINENVGLLIPPKNTKALEKAIEYMLDDCTNYSLEKIAKYAKGKFSYQVVGQQLDEIYREMLVK